MSINIQIGVGELVDKLTILELKEVNIKDEAKLKNIKKELAYLREIYEKLDVKGGKLLVIKTDLYLINMDLWNVENALREHERKKLFDQKFIEYARQVYFLNDDRAKAKKELNILYNSEYVEEKSYEKY